jgi:hypothetical protein
MHYQILGTVEHTSVIEGQLHQLNPHPGLMRALDLAHQAIRSAAGHKVFTDILHPLSSTEVSEHLEESLKSENFPQICIHRNLENFHPHDSRFKRTPNKIWLLAEVSGVPHSP